MSINKVNNSRKKNLREKMSEECKILGKNNHEIVKDQGPSVNSTLCQCKFGYIGLVGFNSNAFFLMTVQYLYM
jgi:hypothetical protein